MSGAELLARLEAQADNLTRVRVRGRKLERALRSEIEKRAGLDAELEDERERNAALGRTLARRDAELQAASVVERELERLQETVGALEAELEATRMQLEAVRAELTARRPLSQRLHPRSWR